MRILLTEDNPDVAEGIIARLRHTGHTVDWQQDGRRASDICVTESYDLVILDVMLPGADGIAILQRMRRERIQTPVLMLTARVDIDARVGALDLGADDYLTKPFDFRELDARVRVLLRRNAGNATDILQCGAVVMDRNARTVRIDGTPVDLTRRELTLLEIIASRPGRVFGKEELVDRLFSIDDSPSQNAVEQYIARLRKKLAAGRIEIKTLRGLGYQMVAL
jgi:two-component system, OmpR family, response regulator TctD